MGYLDVVSLQSDFFLADLSKSRRKDSLTLCRPKQAGSGEGEIVERVSRWKITVKLKGYSGIVQTR